MSREVTHRVDRETGHVVQLVSPERLREILDEDGDTYDRPSDFGPDDEWEVAEEWCERYGSRATAEDEKQIGALQCEMISQCEANDDHPFAVVADTDLVVLGGAK